MSRLRVAPSSPGRADTPLRLFIVGVAGGTGSGKTAVCRRIVDGLEQESGKHHIKVISMGNFYRDQPAGKETVNFDHPGAIDVDHVVKVLDDLKEGLEADVPEYNTDTATRTGSTHVSNVDVVLLEGMFVLTDKKIRDRLDLKIFVDEDDDTRFIRRVRQDIGRGRELEAIVSQYLRHVKSGFDDFIVPSKKHADVVMPRGADNEVAIDLILQHVRTALQKRVLSRYNSSMQLNVNEESRSLGRPPATAPERIGSTEVPH